MLTKVSCRFLFWEMPISTHSLCSVVSCSAMVSIALAIAAWLWQMSRYVTCGKVVRPLNFWMSLDSTTYNQHGGFRFSASSTHAFALSSYTIDESYLMTSSITVHEISSFSSKNDLVAGAGAHITFEPCAIAISLTTSYGTLFPMTTGLPAHIIPDLSLAINSHVSPNIWQWSRSIDVSTAISLLR